MPRPTYRQYERKKLGYRDGTLSGLLYMCRQAFTSPTFAGFWRNWNPLFSYYLLYFCYLPLRKRLPRFIALTVTFALSGAVHDMAATLARAEAYLVFTGTFTLFGLWVVVEERLRLRLDGLPVIVKFLYHLGLIVSGFCLSWWVLKSS
ncbi:MAG TPA: MBOAT family O-acyltransferase [Phaeodactylibacter sp.]|nr:MBOAT family O-acyltransferase [Phaeodactylibacter sp.]